MPIPSSDRLALFDFDETLIHENSLGVLFEAQRKLSGRGGPQWLEALGIFFNDRVYREGIRQAIKHRLYAQYLAFANEADLIRHGQEQARSFQPIDEVVKKLKGLASQGVEVWIVTATPRPFVQGIAEAMKWPVTHVMGTEIPTLDGFQYSGSLEHECQREEKVRRLKEELKDWSGEIVAAYGNSPADLPMMGLAKQGFVVRKGRITKQ